MGAARVAQAAIYGPRNRKHFFAAIDEFTPKPLGQYAGFVYGNDLSKPLIHLSLGERELQFKLLNFDFNRPSAVSPIVFVCR